MNDVNINLRKIANTAARFSKKSKVHAITAIPMAAIAVIAIKVDETIEDVASVYNGYQYKTTTSRKPTE